MNKTSPRVFAAALALILALPVFSATREATSPKTDAAFEAVDGAHREFDGFPALSLTFSRPLDARKDYGKYLEVLEMPAEEKTPKAAGEPRDEEDSPDKFTASSSREPGDTALDGGRPVSGAWVVGENPRLLFFPHVKPQTRYVVRLVSGLPSGDGAQLSGEARFSIRTAAVAPAYYFASNGMVLPATQNGGLPVTTVNVPEVDIQFLRVRAEQLPGFLERVIAGKLPGKTAPPPDDDESEDEEEAYSQGQNRIRLKGAVNLWTLDQIHAMTESVFVGRFLTESKANRRAVTFIPVEKIAALEEPGIYIAVMSQPNRFRYEYQTTYFYVSDLGLHVRQYPAKGADAFVSSLATGKGVPGVDVSWIGADGRTHALAETDADGRAAFAERPKEARVVMARKGAQISLIALKEPALDLAEFNVGGLIPSPIRLFAYSGRDLYRPGERFEVSVMARDADGRPAPAQPIRAILRRPDGKAQWTASWQPREEFAGYYQQTIELPADAATGFWNLELRADPADRRASAVMRLSVEEFLPERMKLDLSSAAERLDAAGDPSWEIDVAGAYLYGSPAAGNRLLGVVNSEPLRNPLDKTLPGFYFGDANEDSVRSRVELPEKTLDGEGKAALDVDLAPLQNRRSPFAVRATLSLLEEGGRPVVRSIERAWWPAPTLIGLRPMFVGSYAREGAPAEFEIVRVDAAGKLLAADELPLRLFRENRNYYWRFDDQRGWTSGFTETDELLLATQVSIPAGGRGAFTVPVNYGRYRVEVLDPETGLTTRLRFYAGWSARDDETQGLRPDRVTLKLDKPAYAEGETAKLTITPPHAGEALITVEGDRLLWMKRMSLDADGATLDIPVSEAWRRHDLYVTAMVLRPGGKPSESGAGVTPARALGLVYLPLERGGRKLEVTLAAPRKMEPNRDLKVRVKVAGAADPGKAGQTAMLTLSAVDVGILNITRFASPDPFAFFFGKQRYGHDLHDIYGRLIEKMAGQKGRLKWGGDAAPRPAQSMPQKVRLVDLFSGPVALDDNGEAEISLPVPDFNGSLRLMAVASDGERFGMRDAEVTVAAPLIVELATPRFLSVGDRALLSLDVQNLAGEKQEVKIRVGNGDGLVIHEGEWQFTLEDQEKKVLRIPIEAGAAFGLTEVEIDIDSPSLKQTRRFGLEVQAATPRETILKRYAVAPGESVEIRDAELSGLFRQTVLSTLAVSDKVPIDVKSAVRGLLIYPYGCAEQTTSTAYPHVFVDEKAARRFGLKPNTAAQRADMLGKAIGRLAGMQAPNGGFSLWGNVNEYQYWLSAYVAHFLLDTREQGFDVPAEMEKKTVDFLLRSLQEGVAGLPSGPFAYNENSVWRDLRYAGSGRFGVLAYGAYVLARQGKAPLSTLRRMHEVREQAHSGLALVHLGLALKLMGDEPRALETIDAGLGKPRVSSSWWGDYGSQIRDSSMIYVLLKKHGVERPGREALVAQVAGLLESGRYLSTQEKLAVFLLGRDFAEQKTGEWSASLAAAGKEKTIGGRGMQFEPLSADDLAAGVTLRNTHTQRLFLELNLSGHPIEMPPARNDAFRLTRTWYTADGRLLPSGFAARALEVGESLIVRVKVKPRGRYANALIVDYVPAGVEIENVNLSQGEQNALSIDGIDIRQAMQDARIKHREFRDDRFVAALRIDREMNLFYRVRVVTPGRFVVPPTWAEDMYQPTVYGLSGGGWTITVTDGKE